MKNLCYTLILFLFPLFIVTCSKDDDGDSAEEKGEIAINGEKYALHKGGIFYFMEHPENVHGFYIELFSSGISGGFQQKIIGKGDFVGLGLTSQNWDFPDLGTYPIVTTEEMGNTGDAICSGGLFGIFLGCQSESSDPESGDIVVEHYYTCISGNVVFNKINNEYEITIDGTGQKVDFDTDNILEDDIDITLYYKGNLLEDLLDEEP